MSVTKSADELAALAKGADAASAAAKAADAARLAASAAEAAKTLEKVSGQSSAIKNAKIQGSPGGGPDLSSFLPPPPPKAGTPPPKADVPPPKAGAPPAKADAPPAKADAPPAKADAPPAPSKADEAKMADEAGAGAKSQKNDPPISNKPDAENAIKKWIKENPGKTIAALAATAAGAAMIGVAADAYLAVNDVKVDITKIEPFKDGGIGPFGGTHVAKITFSPATDIIKPDFLTIEGTNSDKPIDGTDIEIYKIVSKTEVWIKPSEKLKEGGDKGTMTVKTTVAARLGQAAGAGVGALASGAGSAADAASDGILSIFDGFLEALGLPTGLTGIAIIVVVIIVALVGLSFLF